ncbi:hypothetical protein QM716_16965 [Rhodococcus sp. IEGM 1409]|uniref:hypothetical protein n=1 Tax=Rhodococcus sp. IEGM 1409 TaxID=3047082 RepID=UPI0024B85378|nr:hypothetical protein [Rhodococcus sp. IEGM 1409]MDI9901550.1 hypothetical protein [Rhodococcus sp. IEGM 1409]
MVIVDRFSERFLVFRIRVALRRANNERVRNLLRELGDFVGVDEGADIDAVLDLAGSNVYTEERAFLVGLRLAAATSSKRR